jgi:hypothetical protein
VEIWINALKEDDHFRTLEDGDGHRFLTWDAFCQERSPYGLGCTPEQLDAYIEARPKSQQMAADPETKPLAGHGGERKAEQDSNATLTGRGAEYLVRRLKRDFPKIAEALARGEYKSARAAAWAKGWGIGFIVNPIRNLFPSRRHDCNKSKSPTTTSRGS